MGCSGDGEKTARNENASGNDAEVTIKLLAFKPERLSVAVGATVTWSQEDPGTHTVTSGTVEQGAVEITEMPDGKFDAGEIAKGDTFAFTFEQAGTYSYFCELHPATMRGEVRVR